MKSRLLPKQPLNSDNLTVSRWYLKRGTERMGATKEKKEKKVAALILIGGIFYTNALGGYCKFYRAPVF